MIEFIMELKDVLRNMNGIVILSMTTSSGADKDYGKYSMPCGGWYYRDEVKRGL